MKKRKTKVAKHNLTDQENYTQCPLAEGETQLPCVCVCAVHPGAVSLQHSLIHSIFVVVGASVSKEEERWLRANDWHFLLLSNWPSASL